MFMDVPKDTLRATCTISELSRLGDVGRRRLYLYGEISDIDEESAFITDISKTGELISYIMSFNYEDKDKDLLHREPIILYINSPGGDLNEGFALIDAITLSKTPVWTINMGQWSSMSFLIGIAGHRRLSLPSSIFLLHDGISGAFGSANKVQDRLEFEKHYEIEIVKKHVLAHSNMDSIDYDALARVEYYMLPETALKRGFIDEIVSDIDTIL